MNKRIDLIVTCIFVAFSSIAVFSNTIYVTNGSDSGSGSLRQAILDANSNSGADTIIFDIPDTDPAYDADRGVWTIHLLTSLNSITDDSTTIDGNSQTLNRGNTNTEGPEIELDGSLANSGGLVIASSYNTISGLVINRFALEGIVIFTAHYNKITGNYIGTDATGTNELSNMTGIAISLGSKNNTIGGSSIEERNLISGNTEYGILVSGYYTGNNIITGNYIGTDITGDLPLGNWYGNIKLFYNASNNFIGGADPGEGNIISSAKFSTNIYTGNGITIDNSDSNKIVGNSIGTGKNGNTLLANEGVGIVINESNGTVVGGIAAGEGNIIGWNNWVGILVRDPASTNNSISGNSIGTDNTVSLALNNSTNALNSGILVDFGASENTIGPDNLIAHNTGSGITVNHDSTTGNTITRNIILDQTEAAIAIKNAGNNDIVPPVITEVTGTQVSGTSCADCLIELFSSESNEADVYEGSIAADESGNFTWNGSIGLAYVTATATDSRGNTSRLSDPLENGSFTGIEPAGQNALPEQIWLGQSFPNPFPLRTEIHYRIPYPGKVSLKIYDLNGREIATLVNEFRNTGSYSINWYGKDSYQNRVSEGIYYYVLVFDNHSIVKRMIYLTS